MDSVLSGGIVAVLAFGLASWRDDRIRRQARDARDRAVISAIEEEANANAGTALNDRNLVREELGSLEKTPPERLVNPLDPLELGFWELVKLDPPAVVRAGDSFAAIREVARLVGQVNQMLQSRETYRHTEPALTIGQGGTNWWEGLEAYDRLLDRFLGELLDALDRLKPHIADWHRQMQSPRVGAA